MKINITHSRKELLDIVKVFTLPIPNKHELNKKSLSDAIIVCIDYLEHIEPEQEYFFVSTKEELVRYLENQNPAKNLTIKEKDDVMLLAKKIIQYAKNNYYLMPSGYMDSVEVYGDANYIKNYPEIPSVRRAIELINKDPKLRDSVEMKIPRRVKIQLEKKKKVKASSIPLYIKRGTFKIHFD